MLITQSEAMISLGGSLDPETLKVGYAVCFLKVEKEYGESAITHTITKDDGEFLTYDEASKILEDIRSIAPWTLPTITAYRL